MHARNIQFREFCSERRKKKEFLSRNHAILIYIAAGFKRDTRKYAYSSRKPESPQPFRNDDPHAIFHSQKRVYGAGPSNYRTIRKRESGPKLKLKIDPSTSATEKYI